MAKCDEGFRWVDQMLLRVDQSDSWNDNMWSEFELFWVKDMITDFSVGDWQSLVHFYKERSDLWQEKLAQVLDSSSNEIAFGILVDLLLADHDWTIATAIESLQTYTYSGEWPWHLISQRHLDRVGQVLGSRNMSQQYQRELIHTITKLARL